jgi:hypothetical protein
MRVDAGADADADADADTGAFILCLLLYNLYDIINII